jgi:hypothetical protein
MCRARLNFWQAESIVSFLLHSGHLELGLRSNGSKEYLMTSKGERLRDFISEVHEELDGLSVCARSSRLQPLDQTCENGETPSTGFD